MKFNSFFALILAFMLANIPVCAFASDFVLDKKQETILKYKKFHAERGDYNLSGENFFVLKKFELKNKSKNPVKILENNDLYKQQSEQFANQYFGKPDFEYDLCIGIIFPVFLPIAVIDLVEIFLNYSTRPLSNLTYAVQNSKYSSEKLTNKPINPNTKITFYTLQKCPDEKCIIPAVEINLKDDVTGEIFTNSESVQTNLKRKTEVFRKYY